VSAGRATVVESRGKEKKKAHGQAHEAAKLCKCHITRNCSDLSGEGFQFPNSDEGLYPRTVDTSGDGDFCSDQLCLCALHCSP